LELTDEIMAGIEVVIGRKGHNRLGMLFNHIDKIFIKKWLVTDSNVETMERAHESTVRENSQLLEKHHTNLYGPAIVARDMVQNAEPTKEAPNLRRVSMAWKAGVRKSTMNRMSMANRKVMGERKKEKDEVTKGLEAACMRHRDTSSIDRKSLPVSADIREQYRSITSVKRDRMNTMPVHARLEDPSDKAEETGRLETR